MKKYLVPLLLLLSSFTVAQNTVSGRVISKADKKPVPNAVVFINKSEIWATTNNNGEFTLKNIPAGTYQLLITIVGYENYKSGLQVKGNSVINDIEITPANHVLNDVTIKANRRLSSCFPVFEQEFLGTSLIARQCKILNPYAIQFFDIDPKGGFSARSNDFLEIENDALGYKIKFLLLFFIKDADKRTCYFNGESFFEEMHGTPSQEQAWRTNRLECYQGSPMQLLRAIMSDSLAQNGFKVKRATRRPNPYFNKNAFATDPYDIGSTDAQGAMAEVFGLDPDASENFVYNDNLEHTYLSGKELLLHTNQKGLYAITGKSAKDTSINSLYIEHTKDAIPVASGPPVFVRWMWGGRVSFITFTKPYLIFNTDGKILNGSAINIDGFMLAQTRVSTMLPFDYRPIH
jgi:hypothetical protein